MLTDLASAPISEPLRATLGFLGTVTRAHQSLTPADVTPLLALGITRAQIEDALAVAFCFNVITRLADTVAFEVGSTASFDASARTLLTRGYRL